MKKLFAILILGVAALFSKEVYAQNVTLTWDHSPDASVSVVTEVNGTNFVTTKVTKYILKASVGTITNTYTIPSTTNVFIVPNTLKGVNYNFSLTASDDLVESDPIGLAWYSPSLLPSLPRPTISVSLNPDYSFNVLVPAPVLNKTTYGVTNWLVFAQDLNTSVVRTGTVTSTSFVFSSLPRSNYKTWVAGANYWNETNSAGAFISIKPGAPKNVRVD